MHPKPRYGSGKIIQTLIQTDVQLAGGVLPKAPRAGILAI